MRRSGESELNAICRNMCMIKIGGYHFYQHFDNAKRRLRGEGITKEYAWFGGKPLTERELRLRVK